MNDEDILHAVGDVAEELGYIHTELKRDTLAQTIKNVIESAVEKVLEKKSYDEELGKTISAAIIEAFGKLDSLKIDVSPVMRLAAEFSGQNKSILAAIAAIPKPENNDEKYFNLVTEMMAVIKKNSELSEMLIDKLNNPVPPSPAREIESIKMIHFRENDRLKTSDIIPKYKSQ